MKDSIKSCKVSLLYIWFIGLVQGQKQILVCYVNPHEPFSLKSHLSEFWCFLKILELSETLLGRTKTKIVKRCFIFSPNKKRLGLKIWFHRRQLNHSAVKQDVCGVQNAAARKTRFISRPVFCLRWQKTSAYFLSLSVESEITHSELKQIGRPNKWLNFWFRRTEFISFEPWGHYAYKNWLLLSLLCGNILGLSGRSRRWRGQPS